MEFSDSVLKISKLIVAIDQKISKQLSTIINHKKFKDLESNWRSLYQLILTDYSKTRVKIKILDISWNEISKDLNLSYDIKRSSLYYKIYSRELNTAGGLPFGLIVVAHRLSQENLLDEWERGFSDFDDVYTAQLLGELGDHCLCQVLVGLDELFFGDNLDVIMHDIRRLNRIIESSDFLPWQNLRKHKCSRFLNVVLPDYLIRPIYCNYKTSFIFSEEFCDSKEGLWGNAVFLMAINVIREFSRISWFGFLRAYDEHGEKGAIVELPFEQPIIPKISCAVENDNDWSELGLTVLTNVYLTSYYGFFSNSSVKLSHNDSEKVVNMMQTNLMSCRFSHYIKVLLRDKVGNYDSAQDCKVFLSSWLSKYVIGSSFSDESVMARYPLKSFNIDVTEREDDRTIYDCEVTIEPQYQYDLSTVSIMLSTSVRNIKNNKVNV
ncbi:MAG: type VI secretion system contractile sheath domain-containing protein [Succinivibrionaceae bacterium]